MSPTNVKPGLGSQFSTCLSKMGRKIGQYSIDKQRDVKIGVLECASSESSQGCGVSMQAPDAGSQVEDMHGSVEWHWNDLE